MNTSLNQRVLDAVLDLGECTTRQVVAVVGKYVPATTVNKYVKMGERYEQKRAKTNKKNVMSYHSALRQAVTDKIKQLVEQGKIRRVSRGVYAPPLPKIHLPEERTA